MNVSLFYTSIEVSSVFEISALVSLPDAGQQWGKRIETNRTNPRNHHQNLQNLGITTLGVWHHRQTKKRDTSQIIEIFINHQVP
jgi:hypothetical protein